MNSGGKTNYIFSYELRVLLFKVLKVIVIEVSLLMKGYSTSTFIISNVRVEKEFKKFNGLGYYC